MTELKATPGPWVNDGSITGPRSADALPLLTFQKAESRWTWVSANQDVIALIPPGRAHDARLIAAAPELYGLLQLMLTHGERCNWFADRGDYELVEEAEKLLSKARGETE